MNRPAPFDDARKILFEKLGEKQIMALAASTDDHVTVRNVSMIIHDERLFFKTDVNFEKTQQLLQNPNAAVCHWGVSIEGRAVNHGKVTDEPGRIFETLYRKHWDQSYNAYPHTDTEILFEIVPVSAEIWDQDAAGRAFQTRIDFSQETAAVLHYDE
jgi:uncharacterized pyridoxamine 5'-phosphate oxidase family protein